MTKAVAKIAETTAPKQREEILRENAFKPGQSGNPAGRPKGARHKLGSQFLEDLLTDFTDHGKQAIVDMRERDPTAYCKTVASILPKEVEAGEETMNVLADLLARIDGRTRTIVPQVENRPTVQ
jgi:hypothetical protein